MCLDLVSERKTVVLASDFLYNFLQCVMYAPRTHKKEGALRPHNNDDDDDDNNNGDDDDDKKKKKNGDDDDDDDDEKKKKKKL